MRKFVLHETCDFLGPVYGASASTIAELAPFPLLKVTFQIGMKGQMNGNPCMKISDLCVRLTLCAFATCT
jgi:hypothetical protein